MGVRSTGRGYRPTRNHVDHICIHADIRLTHACVCDRVQDHRQLADLANPIPDGSLTLF